MTDKTHRSPMGLRACRVLVAPATFGMQDPALRSRLEQAVGEVRCSPVKRPPAASELTNLVKGIDGRIAGPDAAADAMGRMALDASLAVLRGERPAHLVNPDAYTGRKRAG